MAGQLNSAPTFGLSFRLKSLKKGGRNREAISYKSGQMPSGGKEKGKGRETRNKNEKNA